MIAMEMTEFVVPVHSRPSAVSAQMIVDVEVAE